MEKLKQKMSSHTDFANQMEEHMKELDNYIEDSKMLQLKQSQTIVAANAQTQSIRKEIRADLVRQLFDSLAKLEKDFLYLKNPSLLPRVYEKTLIEIQRRRKFRKVVDEEY